MRIILMVQPAKIGKNKNKERWREKSRTMTWLWIIELKGQ